MKNNSLSQNTQAAKRLVCHVCQPNLLRYRVEDYLGNLPSGRWLARAERPIRITPDDLVVVGSLDVLIESGAWGHVAEVRATGQTRRPLLGKHDYLAQLPPRHRVAGPERAVRIPRDNLMLVRRLDI